jgi:hypothetical protein
MNTGNASRTDRCDMMRLLGAFLPNTLEGTIDGIANNADALRELLKNCRRD